MPPQPNFALGEHIFGGGTFVPGNRYQAPIVGWHSSQCSIASIIKACKYFICLQGLLAKIAYKDLKACKISQDYPHNSIYHISNIVGLSDQLNRKHYHYLISHLSYLPLHNQIYH